MNKYLSPTSTIQMLMIITTTRTMKSSLIKTFTNFTSVSNVNSGKNVYDGFKNAVVLGKYSNNAANTTDLFQNGGGPK